MADNPYTQNTGGIPQQSMPPQIHYADHVDGDKVQMRRMYWCCLIFCNICALISFSVMASAKNYSDATALAFTVGAGVLTWLSSGALLVYQWFGHVTNSQINESPHKRLLFFHLLFCIFAYSGAIASASISADLSDLDDDNLSKSVIKKQNEFVDKVQASCVFAWLAAVAYIVATVQVIQTSCTYDHMKGMTLLHAGDSSGEETLPGFINGFVVAQADPNDKGYPSQLPLPPPPPPEAPPSLGNDV